MTFSPRLDALPPSQRALWPELVFNPLIAQKALCYFEGGDLESLDNTLGDRLLAVAAHDLVPSMVPVRSLRLD